MIHIWDIENLKTLSILQGFHQRGVCTLDFSGGNIKVSFFVILKPLMLILYICKFDKITIIVLKINFQNISR